MGWTCTHESGQNPAHTHPQLQAMKSKQCKSYNMGTHNTGMLAFENTLSQGLERRHDYSQLRQDTLSLQTYTDYLLVRQNGVTTDRHLISSRHNLYIKTNTLESLYILIIKCISRPVSLSIHGSIMIKFSLPFCVPCHLRGQYNFCTITTPYDYTF